MRSLLCIFSMILATALSAQETRETQERTPSQWPVVVTRKSKAPERVRQEENTSGEHALGARSASNLDEPKTTLGKPNVVWIVLDAARAQNFSCYGYERETSPSIDALAREAVLFEDMHSQGFWTPPSVSSYMWGQFFPQMAVFQKTTANERIVIPRMGAVLLPEVFSANGYETCLITSHAGFIRNPCPLWEAFEEKTLLNPRIRRETSTNEAYASFERVYAEVSPWLERPHASPFFLYVHVMDTHFPHVLSGDEFRQWLPEGYSPKVIKNGQPVVKPGDFREEGIFNEADQAYLRGLYDGSIRYADKYVGMIVEKLKERKLFENTFVIVTSDHGEAIGETGNYWGHGDVLDTEELTHVPFIMSGPGLPVGGRVAHVTQLVDLYPTLAELLQLDTDAVLHGKSLLPLMKGPADSLHEYAVMVGKYRGNNVPRIYAQDKDFKLSLDMTNGQRRLWKRPDTIGNRLDLREQYPDVAKRMEGFVRATIVPLYRESARNPGGVVIPRSITKDDLSPASAFVTAGDKGGVELHRDNKWCFSEEGHNLWSNGAEEDSPPITAALVAPNGTYHVLLELLRDPNHNRTGIPASAGMVKLANDASFSRVATEQTSVAGPPERQYVRAGIGEVTTEELTFSLDDVPGTLFFLRRIILVSDVPGMEQELARILGEGEDTPTGPTSKDLEEATEAMRALGYLE